MASPFRMVVIMKREGVSSNFIGQPFSIEMFEKKKKRKKVGGCTEDPCLKFISTSFIGSKYGVPPLYLLALMSL